MNKWVVLGIGLWVVTACQRQTQPVYLTGKWKLQRILQADYTHAGQLRKRGKMPLTSSSYTYLTFTDSTLLYHFQGDSSYLATQAYTRQGDTLRIVPADGMQADPIIETIVLLRPHQLVLHMRQPLTIDSTYGYSEYDTYLSR